MRFDCAYCVVVLVLCAAGWLVLCEAIVGMETEALHMALKRERGRSGGYI